MMRSTVKTILAVICVVVICVCLVLLLGKLAGGARVADLTQQKLYTLSQGTRNILGKINAPITLKFYYSQVAAQNGPKQIRFWNNYSLYVREMLEEYVRLSNGKLRLEVIDPRSFSVEEAQAIQQGIQQHPMQDDDSFYFGLVATNQYGKSGVIKFFTPDRQELVEFDLSKLLSDMMQRDKRKIGVLSSLPVMGPEGMSPYMAQMMRMQGQQVPPPWMLVDKLSETYDVVKAEVKEGAIGSRVGGEADMGMGSAPNEGAFAENLDFLLVIHPKNLDPPTKFAIDQYVMKGGKLLVFVDPYSITDSPREPQSPYGDTGKNQSSDLNDLLANWGVAMTPGAVAVDRDLAVTRRTRAGMMTFMPFLQMDDRCVNKEEIISGNLHAMQMIFSGVLEKTNRGHTDVQPLLHTTAASGIWTPANPMDFQRPIPEVVDPAMTPSKDPLMLAAIIRGTLTTNFPDGVTLPPPPEEPPPPGSTQPASKPATKPAKHLEAVKQTAKSTAVIVVADADMLSDQLAFDDRFGTPVPTGDNLALLLNSLDYLSGQTDLVSIRSRARYSRPFLEVDKIEKQAMKDSQKDYDETNQKIQAFQMQLQQLMQAGSEKEAKLLGKDLLEKQEKLKADIREANNRLRELQAHRREKVEQLGDRLEMWNLLGAPSIILLIAIVLAVVRRIRARQWAARRNDQ